MFLSCIDPGSQPGSPHASIARTSLIRDFYNPSLLSEM
jgi:hypothetical protein